MRYHLTTTRMAKIKKPGDMGNCRSRLQSSRRTRGIGFLLLGWVLFCFVLLFSWGFLFVRLFWLLFCSDHKSWMCGFLWSPKRHVKPIVAKASGKSCKYYKPVWWHLLSFLIKPSAQRSGGKYLLGIDPNVSGTGCCDKPQERGSWVQLTENNKWLL